MSEHPILFSSMYVQRAHTQIRCAEELLFTAQGSVAQAKLFPELDRLLKLKTEVHRLGTDVFAHLEVLHPTIDPVQAAQTMRTATRPMKYIVVPVEKDDTCGS